MTMGVGDEVGKFVGRLVGTFVSLGVGTLVGEGVGIRVGAGEIAAPMNTHTCIVRNYRMIY